MRIRGTNVGERYGLPPERCVCCGQTVTEDLHSQKGPQLGIFAIAGRSLPRGLVPYVWTIARSRLFLGLLVFAIVPIMLENFRLDVIDGMMVYFSLFWFFIFQPLMAPQIGFRSLVADITAYVFTGFIGVGIALVVETFWVKHGAGPFINSRLLLFSVPANVAFIGMTEEFSKQIIVLVFVLSHRLRKNSWKPVTYMMLGISSGLGFSAMENIAYVQRGIMAETLGRNLYGLGAITALTRALYTPFLHAIWAGIVAYAVGWAFSHSRIKWKWAIGALVLAAGFHGVYDATIAFHQGLAIGDVAVSFLLFLSLLLNGKRRINASA